MRSLPSGLQLKQSVTFTAKIRVSGLRRRREAAYSYRLHHNVLATALANKLARIAWTVLVQARSYEARVN